MYGFCQRETTIYCNVVSHWLSPYTTWSLFCRRYEGLWIDFMMCNPAVCLSLGLEFRFHSVRGRWFKSTKNLAKYLIDWGCTSLPMYSAAQNFFVHLTKSNIRAGDRYALFLPNSHQYLHSTEYVTELGAVAQSIRWLAACVQWAWVILGEKSEAHIHQQPG